MPLEAQLRWRLRLTALPAASPLRQGPAARPGRRQDASGTRGWRSGGRPRSPGRAGRPRPVGAWRPAADPARRSQGRGPGGFRARRPRSLGHPPLPAHAELGAAQPRPGRPSGRAAAGPKPLGATTEWARPLSPSKATLAPTPPAEHRTPPLVAGRPGEAVPAPAPAPAPGRGETAEGGGLFPEGAAERHTGSQLAAARLGSGGRGQVQVEGLAGRTAGTPACGGVWVRASHHGSGWGAAAFQGHLLASWPARPAGSAPSGALWWEGPEEVGPAAVPGRGLRRRPRPRAAKGEGGAGGKKPTAPGIPRRSPIQVLTRPDPA